MEIERKFLISSIPVDASREAGDFIRQGYVAVASDSSELRVRARGDVHTLTMKSGGKQLRDESEVVISEPLFEALWSLTEHRRVEKYRYLLPHGGLTIEIDVFEGALAGLLIAEVEFPSEAEADAFVVPDWFGAEVTDDPAYKNQALALRASAVAD